MKAIWIRSDERTITEVDYAGLEDMKKLIGGWLELAKAWPDGDVLYVDEEGKVKGRKTFFTVPGVHDFLAGNGVVVGPEIGDSLETAPPRITVEQLLMQVRFGEFG